MYKDFNIIQPSPDLEAYVKQYTILKANSPFYATQRVIPIGCVELIIYETGKTKRKNDLTDVPQFFLGGSMSSYLDLTPESGEVCYISILFQPYGAKLFLNLPMDEIYNQILSIEDIEDKSWLELCNCIIDTPNTYTNINIIQNFLLKKLYNSRPLHLDRIKNSINTIYSTSDIELTTLADDSCLSPKQFKRVFQDYIGCNPKEFMRVIRFNKVLNTLKIGKSPNFAQIAQEFGYSDQSHLIREFKAFSGYTPCKFLTPDVGLHHFA